MRTSFATILCLAAIPLARAADLLVTVGGTGVLAFSPESVTANPGDTVTFEFHQKNHTVTQSTFAAPCTKMAGGFDSGFQAVAANNTAGPFPRGTFTVADTNPVWVYCRQANHCAQGMVFAINPGTQFDSYKAAAVATGTGAATPSTPTTGGTTPQPSTTNHVVTVGGTAGLVYDPPSLIAAAGDTITFEFHTKNHTATQSSFADPCRKLELTSTTGQTGFDSGFMAVDASATTFPTFSVTVNDTKPIWVYCRQTGHCGQGMVFAANAPTSGNTFDAFQAMAKQINGTGSTGTTSGYGNSAARTSSLGAGAVIGAVLALVAVL